MNMYRIAQYNDETQDCICLKCYGHFVTGQGATDDWKFCPLCGTKWDGVFTKQNPRYKQHEPHDWRNPGYKTDRKTGLFIQSDKPRLLVERGSVVSQKLASDGFYAVQCKPELIWHMVSHGTSGNFSRDGKSAFTLVVQEFKRCVADHHGDYVRLRLLVGTESRVIKEWAKS